MNLDSERILHRAEGISRQRVISRVDRRWEFELVLKMREKLLTKSEKSRENTMKRVVSWGTSYVPKVFSYVIRIYSNSAFRFAAFKSNRSYIPGD